MTEAIRQSYKTFENCMTQMISSISQVAQSLSESMQVMGRAFIQQNTSNSVAHYSYPGHVPTTCSGIHHVSSESSDADEFSTGNNNWTYWTL